MSTTSVANATANTYTQISLAGISGYDFSSITEAMLNNYSLPLNQMNDTQKTLETKKNAWRDINTRMSALETTLDKLRDAETWNATKISSSNESIMKATSTTSATSGTYNIKVTQTALAQTVTSDAQNVTSVDSALEHEGGFITIRLGPSGTGDDLKGIRIGKNASLDSIAKSINDAHSAVNASVVKTSGGFKLVLINKETGEEHAAQLSDVEGSVLEDLGILKSGEAGVLNQDNVTQKAQDAKISINGLEDIVSSSNTFTDVVKGVTLNIADDAASDSTVTVKIESDTSVAETAVQSFVNQYNSLVSFLKEKTKYDSETKVKGDLFADPMVSSLRSTLRSMLSGGFEVGEGSEFTNISQIGITTSSVNFGKDGTLEFDVSKFKEAIADNPEGVKNFLGGGTGDMATKGFANKYKSYVHDYVMTGGRLSETLKSYDTQLKDVKERITDFNRRLEDYKESVKLKFSRLESLLAQLDQDMQNMNQQMAQLTGSSR